MEYINIGMGLLMIAIGFLVKKYPNYIAGYSTESVKDNPKLDLEGLSIWIRNGCILTGLLTILGFYLFQNLGMDSLADGVSVITIIGGTFIMAIGGERFEQREFD